MSQTKKPCNPLTDADREKRIEFQGLRLIDAMHRGDRVSAENWMQAEYLAIAGRSPEQKARMQAAIEKAIDDGSNYFDAMGARDAQQLRSAA